MGEAFDPYLKWLGIPKKHQPPHHYRLLGIEMFESDPDVIANAADQRMAHLKNFAAGPYSRVSQKLLNEIAAARVCLLNQQQKSQYDAVLRQQSQPKSPPPIRNAAAPKAMPVIAPIKPVAAKPVVPTVGAGPQAGQQPAAKKMPPWVIPSAIGGAAVLLMLVLAIAGAFNGQEKPDSDQVASTDSVDKPDKPVGVVEPPPENPPTDKPPIDEVPIDEPPVDEPPVDKPPIDEPPVDEPPVDEPPVDEPPVDEPPVDELPVDEPPIDELPPVEVKKIAVPDIETRRASLKEIREIYQKDFDEAKNPVQKKALANVLYDEGRETKDNPIARFVLLEESAKLAAEGLDLNTAFRSLALLEADYEINLLSMKADALEEVSKVIIQRTGTLQDNQTLVQLARQMSQQAMDNGDLTTAERLLKVALPSARKMRDMKLVKEITDAGRELAGLRSQYREVEDALKALESSPNQPEANLTVGSWFCFIVGDWEKGLPYLAKGSEPTLAKLAKRDMSNPGSAPERAEVGDAWWDLSEQREGVEKHRISQRAAHWYDLAIDDLSGLSKTRVEKRLAEIGHSSADYAVRLNGKDSHVVVGKFAYPGLTPITIEAIVMPDAIDSYNYKYQTVLGNYGDKSGLKLTLYGSYWRTYFYYHYSDSTYGYSTSISSSSKATIDGRWTHVATVYYGTNLRMYVDGKLAGSTTISNPHLPGKMPFVIGADPTGLAGPGRLSVENNFAGLVKSVRISNIPRYTQSFSPPTKLTADAGAKLLFNFTEGRGDTIKSSVGKDIYGKIVNGEWVKFKKNSIKYGVAPPRDDGFKPHLPERDPIGIREK